MGNRLSKIVTKTGDAGETGLAAGIRVKKDHPRIVALGEIDELNCCVGLLRSELEDSHELQPLLNQIQQDLFDIGGQLAMPEYELLKPAGLDELEENLDTLNQTLEPLKEFILPSGSKAVTQAHFARAVCRRAERNLVSLNSMESLSPLVLQYINRLSDGLFIMARILAKAEENTETLWQSRNHKP